MASLSNSNLASQGYAPLPLTPCPICGKRLVTDISKAGTRPGIRYYKCEFYSMGQCSFFSWRERYARLLEGNGGTRSDGRDAVAATGLESEERESHVDESSGVSHAQSHGHDDLHPHEQSHGQSHEHAPRFTSRISVKQVVETVACFSEYKRWLVNEIGFGGILKLPMLQKLNLKFSAWIMRRVDVAGRAICISENKTLRFWEEDIHKVFGVPCGNRDVRGRDGSIMQQSIEFLKMSLGMDKAGAHSLRAAQEFLKRDINEDSSKVEKDWFQIAFVIFAMGHFLAPSTKYDYCQIGFWGAVANTEAIAQFNWCEYVLQVLLDAATKLQKDTMNKNGTVNMFGCHLFFPVFMLDNIDLGLFNTKHDVWIVSFDQVTIRRMTTMASDVGRNSESYTASPLRDASTVCYTRSKFSDVQETEAPNPVGGWQTADVGQSSATITPEHDGQNISAVPLLPFAPTAGNFGPNDYFAYIHNTFPQLAGDPIILLVKELNANSIRHIQIARHSTQLDMFKFTERLIRALGDRCICCRIRGHNDCLLKDRNTAPCQTTRTPLGQKIFGRVLDLSDCEGESSVPAALSRGKRPMAAGHQLKQNKKLRDTPCPTGGREHQILAICTKVKEFSSRIADQVSNMYSNLGNSIDETTFGRKTQVLPKQKYMSGQSYASNPWINRNAPSLPATSSVIDLLIQHVWAYHLRRSKVDGLSLRKQLVGDVPLGHELGTSIIRRWAQLDKELGNESPYISFKHMMELDFAIFVPAILDEGWSVYMWDMLSRSIHVLNPRSGPYGYNQGKKERHDLIVSRLHDALFHCFSVFFASWPIKKDNWGTMYPRIVDTKLSRDESAFVSLQIIRYYDGDKLHLPLTKLNTSKMKCMALHECMKLQGIISTIVGDVLWNALAPADTFEDF